MMKIFPMDVIMGLTLVLSIISVLIGSIIFRGRRDAGPMILLVSGIIGSFGPVLFLLDQVEVLSIAPIFSFALIFIWVAGLIISTAYWRRKG